VIDGVKTLAQLSEFTHCTTILIKCGTNLLTVGKREKTKNKEQK